LDTPSAAPIRVQLTPRARRISTWSCTADSIELLPFADSTDADVRSAGEPDREKLRQRAAHAGPISDDTLLYRVEFHPVQPAGLSRNSLSHRFIELTSG
jgi:hypothetical protein